MRNVTETSGAPGSSRRRRKWAAGLAAAALFSGFFVGVPWMLLEQASATLGEDACTASENPGPPDPAFFLALRKLETVGWFPGFRRLADDVRRRQYRGDDEHDIHHHVPTKRQSGHDIRNRSQGESNGESFGDRQFHTEFSCEPAE